MRYELVDVACSLVVEIVLFDFSFLSSFGLRCNLNPQFEHIIAFSIYAILSSMPSPPKSFYI